MARVRQESAPREAENICGGETGEEERVQVPCDEG